MKLKHLLLTAVAVMGVGSANAQIAAGDYFIQNVESGAYLNGANSWGTKASATKHGQKMGVAVSGAGYTIDSRISNGGNSHYVNQGDNLYVDGAAVAHTITALGDGVYTVQSPNGDYLVQEGAYVNFKPVAVTDAAKWKFLTMDDMFKTLDEATSENPVDATFFVDDANFSRNNTLFSAWKGGPTKNGENDNMCAEAYNKSFDVYQTVSGVPAGFYKVYCQGFFRYGFAGNAQDNYGSEDMSLFPILYANEVEAPLQAVLNEETLQAIQSKGITAGTWSDVTVNGNAYKIPNNMNAASACFSAGLYSTSLDVKVGETGAIKMGFKKTAADNPSGNWTIFDNFEIYFYGIDVEAAKAAIAALQAEAEALYDDENLSEAAKTALETAVSESNLSAAPKASEVAAKTYALTSAINDAKDAIENRKMIAAVIAEYETKVSTLDADGQASFNNSGVADAKYATVDAARTAFSNAYVAAVMAQGVGADFTDAAPAVWTGQSGIVGWANHDENLNGGSEIWKGQMFTGDVMTMTIDGLKNGTYKVVLYGAASTTGARDGFEVLTGQNRAYLFANDALQSMEVYDRTEVAANTADMAELTCGVKDGVLKMGIENKTLGANWFVVRLESITYMSESLPTTDVKLVVSDAKYATFIAPFAAELPAGVKAYTVDAAEENGLLTMTEVSAIAANTPYVLFSESAVNETLSGVSEAEGATYTVGLLTGVYAPVEITEGYVLQNQTEKGIGFYAVKAENPQTVPANKAYLVKPASASARAFFFDAETAISTIEALTSGKAEIYNINGVKINALQKGINIVNGKKIMVK